MHLLSNTVYVVNSPDLVSVVQRNSKTLSFYPFMTSWLQPLLALDDPSMEIVKRDMVSKTEASYIGESYDIHHHMLAPGLVLNQMQNNAFIGVAKIFNEFKGSVSTDMYSFIKHNFTVFNTNAIWGSRNPFRDHPEIEHAFWSVPFGRRHDHLAKYS